MANKITVKSVQEVQECKCGTLSVEHSEYKIRHKDLSKAGIKRRIDQKTKRPFFLRWMKAQECEGCNP